MGGRTPAPITERKTRLDGTVAEYPCEGLIVEAGRRAVVRYVTERDRLWLAVSLFWGLGCENALFNLLTHGGCVVLQEHFDADLVLRAGTVTIGHFWTDRPYNVYHWLEGGRTIAFYVNIAADTTIDTGAIAYTDLVVDVLLRPSGAIEVLDEEELPPDLDPRHRLAIAKALETCVTQAKRLIAEIERETRAALA